MADNNMLQQVGMASNPNFDPAEYARQQQAIAMGQALLQQGMQPQQGEMVSGHYVAPAATQQIARLLQMYVGNKMQTGGNEYMMRTNIGNTKAMLNSFPGGQPQGQPMPAGGMTNGAPGQPQAAPVQPMQAAGGQPQGNPFSATSAAGTPFTRENVIQGMILNGFSPEAAKAFWARTAPAPTQDQLNSRDQIIGGSVQNNLATQNMTEGQKMIRARQQVPDGSPQAQMLDAAIAKSNYLAPVEVRAGNLSIDPISHQPFAYVPPVEKGMSPTFSTQGGITTPTGAQQLPGYAGGAADIAGAVKGAESANGIINVTGPNDAQVPTIAGPAAAAGAAQLGLPAPMRNNNPGALMPGGKMAQYPDMQSGLAALDSNLQSYAKQGVQTLAGVISKWAPPRTNDTAPGTNDTAAYIKDAAQRLGIDPNQPIDLKNPAVRQAVGTAIMLHENGPGAVFGQKQPQLGQSQTGKELTTSGVNMYQSAVKEAQNTQQFHQALNEMWQLANSGKFGPGTGSIARFKAILSNSGVDMSGAQTDQDVMKKMASFISSSQLGSGGTTGTDAQLTNIMNGLPHGEMTNEAMKKVIPLLKGQLDVKQSRAAVANAYYQQHPNDMSGMPQVLNQYNQLADPGTVSIGNSFANASKQGPQAVKALESQMMQHYGRNWAGIKQRIMQLDSIGAFQ